MREGKKVVLSTEFFYAENLMGKLMIVCLYFLTFTTCIGRSARINEGGKTANLFVETLENVLKESNEKNPDSRTRGSHC